MSNHKMMCVALFAAVFYQVSSSYGETENDIDRELRILLIGKKGVGKSTTGNTLLGFPAFDTKVSATSVTSNTQYNETERFGKRLVVIDTPGLFDTDRPNVEVLFEMSKGYVLASPGPHAIILVVQVGRFTEEEEKAVNIYMKVFGEEFKKYLIIVFSHKDRLDASDLTIDDFVRTLDEKSNLKSLIYETEGRYTAIGYRGQQSEREKEVRHIVSMIEKMKETNGGLYYSKDIFKSVEQIMKENEIKKMKETNDKGRMYTEEEVTMLLNAARANSKVPIINNGLLTKFPYTVAKWILALVFGAGNENNDEEEDAKKYEL